MPREKKLLSRKEIESRIAEGQSLIIVEGEVLRVDSWLDKHPGGDTAILHMIGRDATDEVNALHSDGTRQRMRNFAIGRIEGPWDNFVPPIQYGKFRTIQEIEEEEASMADDCIVDSCSNDSSDSASTSCDEKPFEEYLLDPAIRRRRGQKFGGFEGSVTSLSSLSSNEFPSEKKPDHYSIDKQTYKELERDRVIYPPTDVFTQREIARKYRDLEQRIKDEGLFNCNYWAYARECTRYTLFITTSLILLHFGWYKLSAVFLGCFWHQLTFTAHDSGHMGITHDFTIDTCIGIFIADFLGGLSLGWWKRNHNVHHIVTNSVDHDPDIQHIPFFAISHRFFNSIYSTYYKRNLPYDAVAKFFIPLQSYLYYPVLCFGRFNLYRLSLEHLIRGLGPKKGAAAWHRYLELFGMCVFWYWFGYAMVYKSIEGGWNRFWFVMISHAITMPLHVQITLSHFAMSTSDLGPQESFAQKMLRTSMDVDCPEWLDFFHGGLQFQAIHHLYPQIPRHNLRRTQKLVMEFCNETKIPYAIYGFYDGNKEIIGRLAEIGKQARIFAECQNALASGEVEGH